MDKPKLREAQSQKEGVESQSFENVGTDHVRTFRDFRRRMRNAGQHLHANSNPRLDTAMLPT